ncbi:MAG: acyclic terpene utilization AtuA family protein [Pseudomonadota bacterium]
MTDQLLRIGGASGYWGDATRATPQLLQAPELDYIVYDYLAEITMSIMARARAKDDTKGYAVDFVTSAMKPNLGTLAERGIKVVSNAGGVNPEACVAALQEAIAEAGLNLKVACVSGDDLMASAEELQAAGITEMFSGEAFPDISKLQSINAYLGAFPIALALQKGADIVVTGRCVDSAVTLGACIDAFGWGRDDLDQLAMGSLAGHILECGVQATGGNFTDWESVPGLTNIGYPIAEVSADGSFICTKPENTGGIVSVATVCEQMLYEIGDPQAYMLPDVVCDFSTAKLELVGENRVKVSGATGRPPPDTYKVSATFADQFRGGTYMTFYGIDADKKAKVLGEAVFEAARTVFKAHGLADFSETSIELIGAESQFGEFKEVNGSREVAMKIAAKHPDAIGIGIMLKEAVGLGLATPPGLSGFAGGRPKPSPVVRLFSFTVPKDKLAVSVQLNDETLSCDEACGEAFDSNTIDRPSTPTADASEDMVDVPLIKLAWARSGDKGNKANIGIIARCTEYLPFIWQALTEQAVGGRLAHFIADANEHSVERFLLPGSNSINFLIHGVLGGGGVASIRNDPQAKGYSQLLLTCPIPIPATLAEELA